MRREDEIAALKHEVAVARTLIRFLLIALTRNGMILPQDIADFATRRRRGIAGRREVRAQRRPSAYLVVTVALDETGCDTAQILTRLSRLSQ